MYTNDTAVIDLKLRLGWIFALAMLSGLVFLAAPRSVEAAISLVATSSANGTGSAVSPVIPTGTQAGDVMVAWCHQFENVTANTWDDDGGGGNGWTRLFSIKQETNRDRENAVYYKVAGASEATPTFTVGGTGTRRTACLVNTYRGVDQISPFDVTYVQGSHYYQGLNAINPDPPSITTNTNNAWVVQFLALSETTNLLTSYGAPSGYTMDNNILPMATDRMLVSARKEVGTAGAEDAGVWTNSASITNTQDYAGVVLALRPNNTFIVSGQLYVDDGLTTAGGVKTVKMAIGTGTVSVYSTSTNSSGQYQLYVTGIEGVPTSTPILLWVDNETYFKGARFTKASSTYSGSIVAADIYREHLIISTETNYLDTAEYVSITDLSFYDSSDDSDIPYSATTGPSGLQVAPVTNLYVLPYKTLVADYLMTVRGSASASSTDGSIRLGDYSFVFQVSTTTIGGNFAASSTSVWVPLLGGLEFNATTTGKTISSGGTTRGLGRVHFTGVGGEWTFVDDAIVDNITIATGTVMVEAILAVGGDFVNTGTFINNSSITFFGAGEVTGNLTGTSTLGEVYIDQSGTQGWSYRDPASLDVWTSVIYGEGLFVAVSYYGQVMTSQNGRDWSLQEVPEANQWQAVTYGNGRFVAVADSGSSRVMYSDDGFVWVAASSSAQNGWVGLTYGEGLYVAVSYDGANRVMTSANGITWTTRTAGWDSGWYDVTYGNGRFVAVAISATLGVGQQVMYSDNGTTWNTATSSDEFAWASIAYGEGMYVAVAASGADGVMSSADGITWTTRDIPTDGYELYAVEYGNGNFVALASTTDFVLYSVDGITWTEQQNGLPAASWYDLAHGDDKFVAVGSDPTYQIMVSEYGGEVRITAAASSTSFIVYSQSSLRAPARLSVSDNFVNQGRFNASGTGEVILTGGDYQLVTANLGTTTFHNLTKRVTSAGTLMVVEDSRIEITGTLTLAGASSANRLSLRSTTGGVPWIILPRGTTALEYLDVRDVYNASATPMTCSVGCFDSGNNTNWVFIYVPLASVFTGTAYVDGGVTPAAPGATVVAVVGTSTASVYSTTTRASGAFTIGGFADTFIASTTPVMLFYDASSTDALTLYAGYIGTSSATGIPLQGSRVLVYGSSSSAVVNLASFTSYDRDNDADILLVTATSATSTTIFQDLVVQQGTFRASPTSTVLVGSLTNNANFDDNQGTLRMFGSSEVLAGTLTGTSDLGDVRISGSYSVTPATASTTDLIVENGGSFIAPSTRVSVAGNFQNNGTFSDNGGELTFIIGSGGVAFTGRDSGGTAGGTGNVAVNKITISGNYAYVVKSGNSGTCNDTTGTGCELMVFNISSTTNPVYVAGRDSSGVTGATYSTAMYDVLVQGTTLYVTKNWSQAGVACSQTGGTNGADDCELMVFTIASATNPVYVAGRDNGGTSNGNTSWSLSALAATGTTLYVGKYADNQFGDNCTDGGTSLGCALMVYDIASSTNPTLVAKRSATGIANDLGYEAMVSFEIVNNILYAGLDTSYTDACSQTPGSTGAEECELQVYNISSTTNPVFVAGRDASGANSGGTAQNDVYAIEHNNGYLYVAKASGNATACSQTAGSATGCELMIYDVSSSTNPRYVAGLDVSGSQTGAAANYLESVLVRGATLYVGAGGDASGCAQAVGGAAGCELQIYDISSSTNPQLAGALDASLGSGGGGAVDTNHVVLSAAGTHLFAARGNNATACSQTAAGAVGCELVVVDVTTLGSTGAVSGTLTGTNALGNTRVVSGSVSIVDNASTTDFSISSNATATLPALLSVADDLSNAGALLTVAPTTLVVTGDYANTGTVSYQSGNQVWFNGATTQAISGTLSGNSGLPSVRFSGVGSKTMSAIASTTQVTIEAGTTVTAPTHLSVTGSVTNSGTLVAPSALLALSSDFINSGTYTTTGGTVVLNGNLGSVTAGRDIAGVLGGTSTLSVQDQVLVGSYLYVITDGNATACSQVAGSAVGCELRVFDVASSTNPVYVAGRDANGTSNGSLNQTMYTAIAIGDYLYIGKDFSQAGFSETRNCPTAGGADVQYCELMVFNIASRTNPVYVAGRDSAGAAFDQYQNYSLAIRALAATGTTLYAAKDPDVTGNCSQTVGSADQCELIVFNISSSSNPVFVAGRDVNGSPSGGQNIGYTSLAIYQNTLYVGTAGDGAFGCSSSNVQECEVVIYNISSTTAPTYVAGRDSSASAGGTGAVAVSGLEVANNHLYVTKYGNGAGCSQSAGSANGCELLIFSLSSSTNPTYVAGIDSNGTTNGATTRRMYDSEVSGNTLYLTLAGNSGACSPQGASYGGCELLVFSVTDPDNPVLITGLDRDGAFGSTASGWFSADVTSSYVYLGGQGDGTACSAVPGSAAGCEIAVVGTSPVAQGTLTGASALGSVTVSGNARFADSASTTNLAVTGAVVAPTHLSVEGNYTQSGTFTHSSGTVYMNGTGQQTATGTLSGTSAFHNLTLKNTSGNGTTSQAVVFGAPVQTTGTFMMGASTSARFLANATNTFAAVNWTGGAAGTPVWLRSSATGTQWRFTTNDFVSTSYINVRDSLNGASSSVPCTIGCTDAGNNTNWSFAAGPLTVTVLETHLADGDPATTTSDTFTPANNSLLLVAASALCAGGCVSPNGTLSGGGLTWTKQLFEENDESWSSAVWYFTAPVTAGTNMAVTFNPDPVLIDGNGGVSLVVYQITGHDPDTPVAQTFADGGIGGRSGAYSGSFGGAVASSSYVFAVTASDNDLASLSNQTPGTGWTQDYEALSGSVPYAAGLFTSRTASTSSTVLFNNLFSGYSWSVGAIEIRADDGITPSTGSLTLTSHPADQASNLFSFQNQSDGLFYRFSMTAATETAIVDDVVLSVFGLRGVDGSEVTDLRLYRDVNSDGALDGGDTQVLGAGIFAIDGEAGTITFSTGTTSVATTTAQRYIVTADTTAIDNNDWLNVQLRTTGVIATGLTTGLPVTITGSVSPLQHIRSSAGGSGANRSPVGGEGPAGAGQQGGGTQQGGGETGQGQDGANISSDPDFFRPTTNGAPHNEWTGGGSGYASDGAYATAASAGLRQTYGGFGFNIPGSNTVQGITVKLDASGTTAAGTIQIGLSWDGGTTVTTLEATPTLSGSDIVYTVGGQTNLWGRAWTPTELNDTNFRVRVVAQPSANTVRVDALEVRVYHTTGGGGAGGGGEEI